MFGEFRDTVLRRLTRIDVDLDEMRTKIGESAHLIRSTWAAVGQIQQWIELMNDDRAEKIADKFEKLLAEHTKAGHKVTNTELKRLVEEAAKD